MNRWTLSLLTLASVSVLLGAQAHADMVDEATDKFCACSAPLRETMNQLAVAMKSGDVATLQQMRETMTPEKGEAMAKDVEQCMENARKAYEKYEEDQSFRDEVKAAIQQKCPMPTLGMGGEDLSQ